MRCWGVGQWRGAGRRLKARAISVSLAELSLSLLSMSVSFCSKHWAFWSPRFKRTVWGVNRQRTAWGETTFTCCLVPVKRCHAKCAPSKYKHEGCAYMHEGFMYPNLPFAQWLPDSWETPTVLLLPLNPGKYSNTCVEEKCFTFSGWIFRCYNINLT